MTYTTPNNYRPVYYGNKQAPYTYAGNAAPYPYANEAGPAAAVSPAFQGAMTMMPPSAPSGSFVTPTGGNIVTMPSVEESYVENILRLNRGKMATIYMTYENNPEWNAKIFKGVIEAAGRDHIIISDPATGMRFLLLTVNLDYITFDEPINYQYPFQGGVITNTTPTATPSAMTGR